MRLCIFAAIFGALSKATILSAQTIVTQPTNQVVLLGSNATFAVTVAGGGYFSYQWRFNGSNIPNNIVTTIAGSGPGGGTAWGFSGDGGPATNAEMHYPHGVAVDPYGNVFISDFWNQRVRKVGTDGIITTVAGNGIQGSSGNGGAATSANLNLPEGITLDTQGNLYFSEYYNSWVRKVNTNGIITTVTNSFDGGYHCPDVCIDSLGNIFTVNDSGSGLIKKIKTNGVVITVAGGGTNYFASGVQATNAALSNPAGVAVDSLGNIFIAEGQSQCIRKVDTNGIITTIAGRIYVESYSGDWGPATNATLNFPSDIVVAPNGNIFIADSYNDRIRMVDINGIITTVVGGGVSHFSEGPDGLSVPEAVALDAAGNLFIADMYNQRVRKAAFAGFPTLTVNDVKTNNAGDYSVIITSASGSVTSSVVSLVVTGTPPSVVIQPTSQSVAVGANLNLTANAAGTLPLFYQWKFNGTNINGATDSTLSLNKVFPTNAGAFTVAVTNAWGGVVSDAATLSVISIPIGAPHFVGNGQFQFSFDATVGVNYTVEYSTNLFQWFSLLTIGGVSGPISITDPNAFNSQRFYRAVLSP